MSMAEYYAHKDAERPDGSVDFDEVPLRFGGNKNTGHPKTSSGGTMTEIQVFTDSQLAHRVVMLKALADHINREFRYAKGELAERMARGDRLTARDGASSWAACRCRIRNQ
ncbi:hypothetical protein GS860_28265 [Rhodococcus hoagii]|nr:hypothetical protein [Prescottella equi]